MKKYSLSKSVRFLLMMSVIVILASCIENEIFQNTMGNPSDKCISFGVSKDANSWKPYSRALKENTFFNMSSESRDATFNVDVEIVEKEKSHTRGMQVTEASEVKEFDVAAYYYGEGESIAQAFFTEKVTDGVNVLDKVYYWPQEGLMDFMAISPTGVVSIMPTADDYNTNSVSFDYTIADDESLHRDLMTAVSTGINNGVTGDPVPLNFKHLLASVRFKVGDMQFIKIESLSINNVYGGTITFSYDKDTDVWTNTIPTTKKTYYPDFVDTSGLPTESEIAGNINNATLFMVPQTLPADAEICVTYTALLTGETQSGSANIGGQKWEAGKDYAYSFNIGTSFDVTIPTPADQDAHYIMLEMPYDLGALSSHVSSIKATARFLDDGSNTSTKSGISLKFKDDLTETQKWGIWTDKQCVETITVGTNGGSSSTISEPTNIRGETELSINNLSNTIVLFIEENNGTTYRNGELLFTAIAGENEITIGKGSFKQLCPCWNDMGIGVERIEDAGMIHPFGFANNRKVTYTNPGNQDRYGLLKGLFKLLYSWGASGSITDDEGDFITIKKEKVFGLWDYTDKITLNYGALNNVSTVANSMDGLSNTRALYNFTGGNNLLQIETDLTNNLGWDMSVNEAGETPKDYAAFVALTRNRMYELKTITKASGQSDVVSYKAVLYKENNTDFIEWYLPSSEEAKTLVETGVGSDVISSLHGEYWSSTAGSDADAYAHSYTFYDNTFGSVNENKPRMNELKVRAARNKP